MKTICPHCKNTFPINSLRRIRDVSCPSCRRLVFREERLWGIIWTVACVVCALAVGVVIYQRTEQIHQAWTVYVNYLVPAAMVILLAPFGNVLMYLVHQEKTKKK